MHPDAKRVISAATSSTYQLISAANHIPEDKRSWSVGGKAKTAYEILGHCAAFPEWIKKTITTGHMAGDMNTTIPTSMEQAEAELKAALGELIAYIEELPEERWSEKMLYPWAESSVGATLEFFEWNNTYHTGQINYIQLILGDEDMHF